MHWTPLTATLAVEERNDMRAWQYLVDTGEVWQLAGWFGRTAAAMIAAGILEERVQC